MNENVRISINISLKFVPKGLINNIPALIQIMAWRRPGDKPLSEPMVVILLTHICVTRPQWVNYLQQRSVTHVFAELSSCPGYFREPHWKSMGLPEISRTTFDGYILLSSFHDGEYIDSLMQDSIANTLAWCKTAVTPLLTHRLNARL